MKKANKFLVITHNRVYGIPNALRDYLVEKKHDTVVFIAHPLDKTEGDSFVQIFKNGKKIEEKRVNRNSSLGAINFIIDTILTLYWVFTALPRFDVTIGNDNLNAFSGLIIRLFRRTEKVIFYAMDFSGDRLGNYVLNKIYHTLEIWCIKYSDEVWVVSKGISMAREKYLGINPKIFKQKVVPTGVWIDTTIVKPLECIDRHQLFFIGHLLKKQGVQKVLEAIPHIIKEIKDFKFVIIGGGEYKNTLQLLTKKLKIEKHVNFMGIVEKQSDVFETMSASAVGVATYKPEKDKSKNFTYYGDPGKIKDYLSVGLPVVLTDVSYNAKSLEKAGCAIVVNYDEQEIASAIIQIMKSEKSLKRYRRNALKETQSYNWKTIFDEAML